MLKILLTVAVRLTNTSLIFVASDMRNLPEDFGRSDGYGPYGNKKSGDGC